MANKVIPLESMPLQLKGHKKVSKKGDNYMRSHESERSFVCQLQLWETVCLGAYKSEG